MSESHACRFPFLDCPGCERCSVPVTDRFEANTPLRNSLAHNLGLFAQAIAIALVSFVVLFGAGFGIAATFDQARENWTNTRIANVEP